eukprot:c9320_g1_i1 orf=620-3430(-)
MRFRVRNYGEEEVASCLRSQPAQQHPLSSASAPPSLQSSSFSIATSPRQVSTADKHFDDILLDPLRAVSVQDPLSINSAPAAVQERPSYQPVSKVKLDDQAKAAAIEWEAHRLSILHRFTSSDTIKVSATLDIISKHLKGRGKSLTAAHLEELDDVRKGANEDEEIISQEEYVVRLRELNDNIAQAWLNNERVATLRLAVKVAKLLTDTSVPRFYPTLFILVTDVLETIGNLVWKRIKGKAELNDNGEVIKLLPENFTADDVRQEAKDTCSNWFYKIGSIHELIPRIYLEIAILRCMHFLQKDPPISAFQRLNMMIRGLADPLAAAYARLYLARKGQSIIPHETGYLIMGLDDYLLLYRRVLSGDLDRTILRSGLNRQAYASLVEPVFELYLQYICAFANKEELLFILRTFCEQRSGSNTDAEGLIPVSVLVHYLLRHLPALVVSNKALELSKIVKRSVDVSKPQYLNYRLLGAKLCECHPPRELRITVLNDVWKVVLQFSDLVEYLTVADVFVEYILQCCSETELSVLLRDIVKHLTKAKSTEEALRILESIVIKIMSKAADIKHLLTMPYFVDILDKFHGDTRNSVHRHILLYVSRNSHIIQDPVTRHFVFEISKSLYKSLDSMSSEDEQRQIARLISRFVQLVNFEQDVEQHLSFLVDCRGTFATMNILRETVVHVSNRLAMATLRIARGRPAQHAIDFIKTCITFNEVTIPSLKSVVKRILLYIETAEVAMMSSLVSHSESVLKSSITCLQEWGITDDARNTETEMELLGCIRKLCSFLIIFPGHPELGTFYLLGGLLHVINTELRLKEPLKIQALLGVILACNALSQERLPYHTNSMEIISNDELFSGELSYLEELAHITVGVVESITTSVNKAADKENEALIACEVFATAFECGDKDDIYQHCAILAKAAKPLLPKHSKLSNFMNKFSTL